MSTPRLRASALLLVTTMAFGCSSNDSATQTFDPDGEPTATSGQTDEAAGTSTSDDVDGTQNAEEVDSGTTTTTSGTTDADPTTTVEDAAGSTTSTITTSAAASGLRSQVSVDMGDLAIEILKVDPTPEGGQIVLLEEGRGIAVSDPSVSDVVIDFTMTNWATGETVQSSADDFGESLAIPLGGQAVPQLLEDAMKQRKSGDVFLVTFPAGMTDLPEGFSPDAVHVLAVRIVAAY